MILFLNFIVPIFVIGMVVLSIRMRSWYPVLLAVVLTVGYTATQPSYIPKGTVRSDPVVEFTPNNSVIIDRQLKSVTREQRLLELQDDYDAANKRREEMVEKLKGEKPEL